MASVLPNYPMPKSTVLKVSRSSPPIIGFNRRKSITAVEKEAGVGLNLDVVKERKRGFMGLRRTKVVCMVGPASCSYEQLEKLAMEGMNVARLDMCHNTRDWHQDVIKNIKKLNREKGLCVSVMIDTHFSDHGAPSSVKAQNGSLLFFWKNGKVVEKHHDLPTLWTQDWSDIEFGISQGVDFIAVSFVKDADAVKHLKDYLSAKNKFVKVFAKIERLESLHKLEEIVEASDGIMVAKGDLGLNKIPTVQKEITNLCRQLNKPVIIASLPLELEYPTSQVLKSMEQYPTTTQAEVADVWEAVGQFFDALMLSGDSANGSLVENALFVLQMAIDEVESWTILGNKPLSPLPPLRELKAWSSDYSNQQICICAAEMANKLVEVDAVFVYTKHGLMASLQSRNRHNLPIFAFTNEKGTQMVLNLLWGVTPIFINR